MERTPSHRQAPRRNWTFLAVVILQLLTVVLLWIFAPATVMTVELLGPLFALLVEILNHV